MSQPDSGAVLTTWLWIWCRSMTPRERTELLLETCGWKRGDEVI